MKYETHLGCKVERTLTQYTNGMSHEQITLSGPAVLQTYVPRIRIGSTVPKRHAGA